MNTTKRLENTVKALQENQLKKALYLTDNAKTQRQHEIVKGAAKQCLANKGDKAACELAVKTARESIHDSITPPMEDTSLEGLEEFLIEQPLQPQPQAQPQGPTDEEEYENCEECHVATAVEQFLSSCEVKPNACRLINEKLDDQTTSPAAWLKAMIEVAEQTEGEPKAAMVQTLTDLTDYLERRNSAILKEL